MADRSSRKVFKYPGGFLKSEPFRYDDDERDEHIYALVWGAVIHNPKIHHYKTKTGKKTEFAIRFRRNGHIIINIFGDTPAADEAAMLKEKERVVAFGTITRHPYVNRDGEEKETRIMYPFFIIPCDRLLEYLLMLARINLSPTIGKILDSDEEDVFESAGDYYAEPEKEESKGEGFEDLFV